MLKVSSFFSNMHNQTLKPRQKPAPYKRRSQKVYDKDAPATSTKPNDISTRRNLILNDWFSLHAHRYGW